MRHFCLVSVVTWFVVGLARCSGEDIGQEAALGPREPLRWESFANQASAVVVYQNANYPTRTVGRFNTDSAAVATMTDWLKSNWNKGYTSLRVDFDKKVEFLFPNLVTVELTLFQKADPAPVEEFLHSPRNHKLKLPLESTNCESLSGCLDTYRQHTVRYQQPIDWDEFERSSYVLMVFENGKVEGRCDGRHPLNDYNWRDPDASANDFRWMKANWHRFPLGHELSEASPTYRITAFLYDGLLIEADVYTYYDKEHKRPIYEDGELDPIVRFLQSSRNHKDDIKRRRIEFGHSKLLHQRISRHSRPVKCSTFARG